MTAPGWAKHLDGIDPKSVTSRAALAELPLLRKSDLPRLQAETPPFGGFNVTPPGKAKRLLMSPGPIFEPEGHEKDFAGVARAMFAAGFRDGHIVLNCFSYHLTPGAWMFEVGGAGARLRRHSRRRRQYRAAGRGDRAAQARRLYRHAGLSEDAARYRAGVRQGRVIDQARSCLRRGAAGRRCGRNCRRAASRCCNAMPSPRPA